jgi:hypothetical protein
VVNAKSVVRRKTDQYLGCSNSLVLRQLKNLKRPFEAGASEIFNINFAESIG